MSKVYNAYKCDCCGRLQEGEPGDGMYLILTGDSRYLSLAEDKYEFHDICADCRITFRAAIVKAGRERGWYAPIRAESNAAK